MPLVQDHSEIFMEMGIQLPHRLLRILRNPHRLTFLHGLTLEANQLVGGPLCVRELASQLSIGFLVFLLPPPVPPTRSVRPARTATLFSISHPEAMLHRWMKCCVGVQLSVSPTMFLRCLLILLLGGNRTRKRAERCVALSYVHSSRLSHVF